MEDRYLNTDESIKRLVADYNKHKSLLIAFDFDNTVFDFHEVKDTYPKMEKILIKAKSIGCKLILYTAQEGKKLDKAVKYCFDHGYFPDYVNESPVMTTKKPYFNILLDDRAGLFESYTILKAALKELKLY